MTWHEIDIITVLDVWQTFRQVIGSKMLGDIKNGRGQSGDEVGGYLSIRLLLF